MIKGIVHPKMSILSSFVRFFQTCMSFFLLLNTNEDILKNVGKWTVDGLHCLPWKKNTMEVNGAHQLFSYWHSSKYLRLCSTEERNSYRFGTAWGWVNDDNIFIFGWTIPLRMGHFWLHLLNSISWSSFKILKHIKKINVYLYK